MLKETRAKIDNIDFVAIKKRLCLPHKSGGFAWELSDAETAVQHYVKFFAYVADQKSGQSSGQPIFSIEARHLFEQVITEEFRALTAIVWEAHILNTRQYGEDCFRILKCFLHYSPGLVSSEAML